MNRKLLTGLAIATVAGTGGVAFASVSVPAASTPPQDAATAPTIGGDTSATASTVSSPSEVLPAAVGPSRSISYEVGDAGTISVEVVGSSVASRAVVPAEGWNIVSMENTSSHIAVRFLGVDRVVGFTADLAGADVVVSVTNERLPGNAGEPLFDPLLVAVVADSDAASVPAPTTPVAIVAATPSSGPIPSMAPAAPHPASTTAPSSVSNGDDKHDDHGGDHEHSDQGDHDSSDGHDHASNGGDDD